VPVDHLILLASFCSADSSTLAGDLQRILSTMHELDERADGDDFDYFFQWKIHFENLLVKNFVARMNEFPIPSCFLIIQSILAVDTDL
jgi:hypothetical protein